MEHFLLLAIALYAVIQGAQLATHYSEKLAEGFHLSRYIVGFIIVSFISILPEMLIAINAALQGNASFGLGALLGSNVADLSLIFAILVFVAGKAGIPVEKSMWKKLLVYPLFLTIPLILGADGHFSRAEGLTLIIIGIIFYVFVFKKSIGVSSRSEEIQHRARNVFLLVLSMGLLLAGAHFTGEAAQGLAGWAGVNIALIGVLIVSLGTTIPELSFSIKAIQNKKPALAVGDILGSVLADATLVIGIVAMISPFDFPRQIIFIAGGWMVMLSVLLLVFMKSQRRIKRPEALILIFLWLFYILIEITLNS